MSQGGGATAPLSPGLDDPALLLLHFPTSTTTKRTHTLRNSKHYDILPDAFDMGDITDVADDYAEPGYTLSEGARGVVFGDWNKPRLANIIARMGFDLAWLDEWTRCEHCYRAFRTQPDS